VGTMGFVLVPSRLNPTLSVPGLLAAQLAIWATWVLWTWMLWTLGDLLGRRAIAVVWQAIAYTVIGVMVVIAQIFWQAMVANAFGLAEGRGIESTLVLGVRANGDYYVVIYAALVLAQLAFRWLASLQAERVHAAQVNTDLAQAQLHALRTQLQPHFLFNALNSIMALIGRDPALAQQVVVQLSDLLRLALRTSERQVVPLSHELELTRRYLALEQVRFIDRLRVQWHVAETSALSVPAFALQPLVENALVHGIARTGAGGTVTISTRCDAEFLTLQVHNSGPGLWPPSPAHGNGMALANLRIRLERLYGAGAELRLQDGVGFPKEDGAAWLDGVVATLRLPRLEIDASDIAKIADAAGEATDVRRPAASKSDHGLLPT
jgi:hypothetical protein